MSDSGWIGVDLDGTLAVYAGGQSEDHIGAPVPLMVERVKQWLAEEKDVRIFTTRIVGLSPQERVMRVKAIGDWCHAVLGTRLLVTSQRDSGMVELWDDRCVQVVSNKGITAVEAALAEREVKGARRA